MTAPRLSRLATTLLDEDPPVSRVAREDEERMIRAIEASIREEARRRIARRVASIGGVAVAASLTLFAGSRWGAQSSVSTAPLPERTSARAHALSDGVFLRTRGAERALDEGMAVTRSDALVTKPRGRASIAFGSGTQLVLEGSSELEVVEQGPTLAFALASGAVRADVAKLRQGERFLVRTLDAEIEVRGTSFTVQVVPPSPTCGEGTKTRVAVVEGVVVVRGPHGEDRVGAGESWPRGCLAAPHAEEAAPAPQIPPPQNVSLAPPHAAASPVAVPAPQAAPSSSTAGPASELKAQNALYAEATAARRRGDNGAAVDAYDRFVARYPASPLAESALVERMRVLASSDTRRGADAARAYLVRYPHGFARQEASELAARSP